MIIDGSLELNNSTVYFKKKYFLIDVILHNIQLIDIILRISHVKIRRLFEIGSLEIKHWQIRMTSVSILFKETNSEF